MWATCNVGANVQTDFGNYYSWAETTPKNRYELSNYSLYYNNHYTYYNDFDQMTQLQFSNDAATVNWGYGWRTPTYEEINELEHRVHGPGQLLTMLMDVWLQDLTATLFFFLLLVVIMKRTQHGMERQDVIGQVRLKTIIIILIFGLFILILKVVTLANLGEFSD